jgi:hypothetical protein
MANKFEEEIKDGTPVEEIVNPLDEAVNEKTYSKPNVNTSMDDLNRPIEEPKFTPPPFKKTSAPNIPSNTDEGSTFRKREPINPEMKSLPKKEVQMASKQAAALCMKGYEMLHNLGNKALQVSEKKLNKLQASGEINLNAEIDYDYGKRIRAGEFFQEYNKQVDGILKVSDEFKEEVTPILERVLEKRGIGMTDEQTLMFMFGQDIAVKSFVFFQQKAQLNQMIQAIKEATVDSVPPPRPQQRYQQPQPQPRQSEPQVVEVEEEENDFMPQEPEEKQYSTSVEPVKKRVGRPKKQI